MRISDWSSDVCSSDLVGNLMLVIINLPLIGVWVRLLGVPYRFLFPAIILLCCIGVYSVNNAIFDVVLAGLFAGLGLLLYKLRCEPAPLLLGFILGPMMEENLRRAMVISRGDATVFFTSPVSIVLLICAVSLVLTIVSSNLS